MLRTLLSTRCGPSPEFIRQITPFRSFSEVSEPSGETASFLRSEFSAAYCQVSDEWSLHQLRMATQSSSSFKPRFMIAGHGNALFAIAICLPQRGGSMKILLLTKTSHQGSLIGLLEAAVEFGRQKMESSIRRIYTQVHSRTPM